MPVEWRGQKNPCRAFVRNGDAVIVDADGRFVTVLKGGAEGNERDGSVDVRFEEW